MWRKANKTLAPTGIGHLLAWAPLVCISASANPAQINDKVLKAPPRANHYPAWPLQSSRMGRWCGGNAGFTDVKNQVPVRADTRFRLASASKFATQMLLARLVEQGRLDLSAPISHYLPDCPRKTYPTTSLQPAAHIAGMPHHDPLLDANALRVTGKRTRLVELFFPSNTFCKFRSPGQVVTRVAFLLSVR